MLLTAMLQKMMSRLKVFLSALLRTGKKNIALPVHASGG